MLITTVVKVDTVFKSTSKTNVLQIPEPVENKFNKANEGNAIFNSENEKTLGISYIICLKNKN